MNQTGYPPDIENVMSVPSAARVHLLVLGKMLPLAFNFFVKCVLAVIIFSFFLAILWVNS